MAVSLLCPVCGEVWDVDHDADGDDEYTDEPCDVCVEEQLRDPDWPDAQRVTPPEPDPR